MSIVPSLINSAIIGFKSFRFVQICFMTQNITVAVQCTHEKKNSLNIEGILHKCGLGQLGC